MSRRARGAVSAMVVAFAVAAVPTSPAHAAVSFSDAEEVTSGALGTAVLDLAVGGDGSVGVVSGLGTGGSPAAAVRAKGGDFSTPEPLPAGFPGTTPDIALDRAGNAIVVASDVGGLVWRFRPRGGSWSAPQPLNPVASLPAPHVGPRVAFLSDGTAIATWVTMDSKVEAVTRPPGGSFSSTPTRLSDPTDAPNRPLTLTTGPDGRALVTWVSGITTLRAARRRPGGWDGPATIGSAVLAGDPTAGFRPDGAVDVAWHEQTTVPMLPPIYSYTGHVRGASLAPSASTWTAIDQIDSSGAIMVPMPILTMTPDVAGGQVVWSFPMASAVRQAGAEAAGFKPATTFATGMDPRVESLAGDRRLITWMDGATSRYAVLGPGGAQEARGTMPRSAPGMQLVTDPVGRSGAIAWTTTDIATTRVHAMSIDDPAPPAAPAPQDDTPASVQSPPESDPVDLVAPALSRVRLSRSRFRVGAAPTALGAARRKRTPTGSELSWASSEAGRVRIDIERSVRGYRAGRRCVTKVPRKRSARIKRCTLVDVRGTFVRPTVAGANRMRFSGRVGKRALAAGAYRFALIAVDDAGNRSTAKRVAFTVVKR